MTSESVTFSTGLQFSRAVARLCIAQYDRLPKTGKPQTGEWTVLAGVVQSIANSNSSIKNSHNPSTVAVDGTRCSETSSVSTESVWEGRETTQLAASTCGASLRVVALSTGSKCLGSSRWCFRGTLVHDSHAEVLARRCFQAYLMEQVEKVFRGEESVLELCTRSVQEKEKNGLSMGEEKVDANNKNFVADCYFRTNDTDDGNQTDCATVLKHSNGNKPETEFTAGVFSQTGPGEQNLSTVTTELKPLDVQGMVKDISCPGGELRGCVSYKSSTNFGSNSNCLLSLKPGVSFHMYVSHTPCGDCSIFPKEDEDYDSHGECLREEDFCNVDDGEGKHCKHNKIDVKLDNLNTFNNKLLTCENITEEPSFKKFKCNSVIINEYKKAVDCVTQEPTPNIYSDIHRTGAKCASGETLDLHLPGASYHTTGSLRTKPGRGDPTLSHCCSDKLLRWSALGMQGCLLMLFLKKAVYLSSIVIGGDCSFNTMAMQRGLCHRYEDKLKMLKLVGEFQVCPMKVLQSDVLFHHSPAQVKKRAVGKRVSSCPSSLTWCPEYGPNRSYVVVDGRKLGVTKKALGTVKSQVPVCRLQVMQRVLALHAARNQWLNHVDTGQSKGLSASKNCETVFNSIDREKCAPIKKEELVCDNSLFSLSYLALKNRSSAYKNNWKMLKEVVLTNWTKKPDGLQNFTAASGI